MPIAATGSDTAVRSTLNALLVKQRAAQLRDGAPSAAIRIDRLNRCIGLLVDHRSEIETALNADFGARSAHVSAFADVASSIGPLKHARQHVARWMKTEKRRTTPGMLGLFGAKAEVRLPAQGRRRRHQPLELPGEPDLRAAGRRPRGRQPGDDQAVGIHAGDLGADGKDVREAFDEEEIAVFTGGPEVGQAFAGLAFDHLIFTGATRSPVT